MAVRSGFHRPVSRRFGRGRVSPRATGEVGERRGQGCGGGHLSVSVRTGSPYHAITTAALERAADLIVIATHGHTGAQRILLGSTTERVVGYAPCPVLVVPSLTQLGRRGKKPWVRFRKILVPLDFSKLSEMALPWAGLLSERFGAEIVLLHVMERFPLDHILVREMTGDAFAPFTKTARTDLEQRARSLGKSTGTNVSALVRHGKPYERICQTAKSLGADLIVLSTHGHTGLKHVLLGSTAERVIRHSPCPVLAVRELRRKTR